MDAKVLSIDDLLNANDNRLNVALRALMVAPRGNGLQEGMIAIEWCGSAYSTDNAASFIKVQCALLCSTPSRCIEGKATLLIPMSYGYLLTLCTEQSLCTGNTTAEIVHSLCTGFKTLKGGILHPYPPFLCSCA